MGGNMTLKDGKAPAVKDLDLPPDEDNFDDQPPLRPERTGSRFKFNVGGDAPKTVLISIAVTLIILGLMSVVGKGGLFVNKSDFTKNMTTIVGALDNTVAIAQKAQTDVATAIQSIPNTVSSQVSTAVTQKTSEWESKLSALSARVTTAETSSQTNASKIADLTAKLKSDMDSLTSQFNSQTATLATKDTELATKNTELATKITALEARITALENQAVTTSVTVTSTVQNLSIVNGVSIGTPLTITNSGVTNVTVPVKLVVTAPSGVTSPITSTTMTGTYTSSISGLIVTYYTTAYVPANSTVTFSGISIVVNYTGTPSTTWTAQWSKQ
jgi:chaperonin cofactor prefoldin